MIVHVCSFISVSEKFEVLVGPTQKNYTPHNPLQQCFRLRRAIDTNRRDRREKKREKKQERDGNGIHFEQQRDGSGIHSSNFTRSGTGQEFYFTSSLGLGWDRISFCGSGTGQE